MARVVEGAKSYKTYNCDLGNLFFEAAETFADKIFQVDAECNIKETYKSAKTRSIRTAIALKNEGINSSDIVMICSGNTINNAIPCIAALYLGAKVATIDPTLSERDVEHCLKIVPPKFIFVQDTALPLLEEGYRAVSCSAKIIVFGESKKYTRFEDFSKASKEEGSFRPGIIDHNETAFILFSSGTTGLPKGICCSHRALYHATLNLSKADYIRTDAMLHFTSLYWISAVLILVMAHLTGGSRILANQATPEKTLEIIDKHKVTFSLWSPSLTYSILSVTNREKYDLSSFYSLTLAGSSVDNKQLEKTRKFFNHTKVQLSYGLSEASGVLTFFDYTKDKDAYKTKIGSSGKPLMDCSFKIVDPDTGIMLPPGKKGEVCIKTPGLFSGYYNQDCSNLFDKEGFFMTGDVGYYDEEGFLYVVDRIKEMFKFQGWHIIPTSIEQVLMEHPDVLEAVVFGVPHEADGDRPAACVILKQRGRVTSDDLHKFIEELVADRQKLRGGIKFVEKLPKTPSGKYQRRKIKELFLSL